MKNTIKFAVRKFSPFESALEKAWKSYCSVTSCDMKLDIVPLDLHSLYDATLGENNGLASGEYDISHLNTDWIGEVYEKDVVVDLNNFIKDNAPDDYPNGWSDSMIQMQRFEDKILGLPFHNGPECLIYRKDLFESDVEKIKFREKYGKELKVPTTWDDFFDVAHFFQRPNDNLYGTAIAAFPDGHNTVFDFCLQLWSRKGKLMDENGNININTSQAAEGLAFYQKLLMDDKAVYPDCANLDSVTLGDVFARGEIAMMVNWFGFYSMSQVVKESKVKGKIDIAAIPAGSSDSLYGESVSLNAYWLYCIGSGSKNKEIAYDFIKFLTTAKEDKRLTVEGGIGCRLSTWYDKEINNIIPSYDKLEEIHKSAKCIPRKAYWKQVADVIDKIVLDVLKGEKSIQEILKSGQEKIEIIEKGYKSKI